MLPSHAQAAGAARYTAVFFAEVARGMISRRIKLLGRNFCSSRWLPLLTSGWRLQRALLGVLPDRKAPVSCECNCLAVIFNPARRPHECRRLYAHSGAHVVQCRCEVYLTAVHRISSYRGPPNYQVFEHYAIHQHQRLFQLALVNHFIVAVCLAYLLPPSPSINLPNTHRLSLIWSFMGLQYCRESGGRKSPQRGPGAGPR